MMMTTMNKEGRITHLQEQLPLMTHHLHDLLHHITGKMNHHLTLPTPTTPPTCHHLHPTPKNSIATLFFHQNLVHHHLHPTPKNSIATLLFQQNLVHHHLHPPPKNSIATLLFHQILNHHLLLIPLLMWNMLLMILKPIIPIVRIYPPSFTMKPTSLLPLTSPTNGLSGSSPRPIPTTPSLSEMAMSFLPHLIRPMTSRFVSHTLHFISPYLLHYIVR
jgi:hypothetical protein